MKYLLILLLLVLGCGGTPREITRVVVVKFRDGHTETFPRAMICSYGKRNVLRICAFYGGPTAEIPLDVVTSAREEVR